MESQAEWKQSSPEVAKGCGGPVGARTGPKAVKAPRARQDRAGEYWPGSLQKAGKQAAEWVAK